MIALALLSCIMLRAISTQAKVLDSFDECKEFFYKGTAPEGLNQAAKKICQVYTQEESKGTYYATLYSVHHRIPLYSAYTFHRNCSRSAGETCDNSWHVEPQISQSGSDTDHMVLEKDSDENSIKGNQAISSDYSGSGYDRGQLYRCGDGRMAAACTLTNAAPMDACFNRVHWNNWESRLKSLLQSLVSEPATAYIVTGAVPSAAERIPQKGTSGDSERVTVPSHIWTAVCYKHHTDDRESFSFAYMGRNKPGGGVSLMSVSRLNDRLSELYREQSETAHPIKIFADDCFGVNNKINVLSVFQNLTDLPVNQRVRMSSGIQNAYLAVNRAISSDSIPAEKVKVSEMTVQLAFDSMGTYYSMTEELKVFAGIACLITRTKPETVECQLVPEKQNTAADGSPCSSITEYSYSCQCNTEGKTKPCCSSPCLYQDKLKGYGCYSDQKLIECSPRYSLVTVLGKRCLDDHPCATYGKDYYWCKTGRGLIKDDWGYCSPPLWSSRAKNGKYCRSNHACAKYGEKQPWCYTDYKDSREQCCTSDDCYSAVNGQTCRSDHPCGYHGKNYLWCNTYGKSDWDYCCKDCRQ